MPNIDEIIKMFTILCRRVADIEKEYKEHTKMLKDILELVDKTSRSELKNFLYKPKEAAEILNISPKWLSSLFSEGEIGATPVTKNNKVKVYTRFDIEEFVEKRRIPPLK